MKVLRLFFLMALLVLANLSNLQQREPTDEQKVERLEQQLQSLHPNFVDHFIEFYHLNSDRENSSQSILNITRVSVRQSAYLLLVAKMYLYRILPNNEVQELHYYNTQSNYMAIYYYLRVAAQHFENNEAYYLLGILEQYKLVPDKLLEINIEAIPNRNPNQQILLKYLQQSHLYNAESNLFMSSAKGYHPSSLILAYMNRNRLGTSKNCTTALAYYLSVIKDTYVESFYFRQVYSFADSLEEELYSRKKLTDSKVTIESHFVEETEYLDDQIIEATIHLADSYYMGSGGYVRNLTRAARLYEKLAQEGNRHAKIMAGLCYFKGEGVPVNRQKAKKYFSESSKDQISDYMLLAIKYFQILEKGTKQKALSIMLQKYKSTKSTKNKAILGSHLNYLIGSAIVRGQLKEKGHDGNLIPIPEVEGYQLLDTAATQGNTLAKVLLGILFSDGVTGLKYGCEQATKYFAQESFVNPFFMNRVSAAQVALNRGWLGFSLVKYMELSMVGYENAYVNLLYFLEVYGEQILHMGRSSWSIKEFKSNQIYKQLHKNGLVDVESFILKLYTIKGKPFLNLNNLEKYLSTDSKAVKQYHSYMRKKVIKWGSIFDKRNILKYYEYRLTEEEHGNTIPILTSLASGDSDKPYVSEARYLLGKHHHHRALENKSTLTPHEHFRILGEYNRAVKSQLLGLIIFHIEEYLLGKESTFDFFESDIGKDLLTFIFVVSIIIFALYYLRSKRIDHFHKSELEKQMRKAAEQKENERILQEQEEAQRQAELKEKLQPEAKMVEEKDINQPIIIQDQPKGVRIGSSLESEENP